MNMAEEANQRSWPIRDLAKIIDCQNVSTFLLELIMSFDSLLIKGNSVRSMVSDFDFCPVIDGRTFHDPVEGRHVDGYDLTC